MVIAHENSDARFTPVWSPATFEARGRYRSLYLEKLRLDRECARQSGQVAVRDHDLAQQRESSQNLLRIEIRVRPLAKDKHPHALSPEKSIQRSNIAKAYATLKRRLQTGEDRSIE